MTGAAIGIDVGGGSWAVARAPISPCGEIGETVCSCVSFEDDIEVHAGACVMIDSPIGFITNASAKKTPKGLSGDRAVDIGARKWCLSTSSVFHPPTEEQFASARKEHDRAKAANGKRVLGNVVPGGMSRQSFELVPAMESARKLKARFPLQVFESHPEVVFTVLAKGKVPAKKASLFGGLVRAGVLTERFGRDVLPLVLSMESKEGCPADNWLDALSMLVVAADWAIGKRKQLKSRDGRVHAWTNEMDCIIALPSTDLSAPPAGLTSTRCRSRCAAGSHDAFGRGLLRWSCTRKSNGPGRRRRGPL